MSTRNPHPARLFIPPEVRSAVSLPAVPLLIADDERQAVAAAACRLACVAVPGGIAGPEVWADLTAVAWSGRRVFLVGGVADAGSGLADVLRAAGAVVRVIHLPGPDGRDQRLDDHLAENGPDAVRDLIASTDRPPADGDGADEHEPRAVDRLVDIACGHAALWHDQVKTAFASVGRRAMPVRSKAFRHWLICRFRAANNGTVPNADALTNAISAVEAQAVLDGPEHDVHVRIAAHGSRVYLHLADADDTVIEVDSAGWRECPDPPVRFRRASGGRPLPRPEPGGSLDDLRQLIGLADRDQFALIVGFVSGAMFPGQPQPLLVANGEQGSGKTTISRAVKLLLDPNAAPVRSEPREIRDLMIAARNNHLLVLDNLSRLPVWLSDALCRLATGGGFTTRELYTDDGEVIFDARRPVVLNGIEDIVTRGDLLERSILLRLPAIPEDRRVPESQFWERFHALHPTLLGALLDRVAGGLKELPSVHLDRLPRMADFARWCVACERGAGEEERFLAAYTANQGGAHEQALDGSCVPGAVVAFMTGRDTWEGTPTELHHELFQHIAPPAPRDWPKAANALIGRLRRLAPNLRRVHRLDFQTDRRTGSDRGRIARIVRLPADTETGSSGPSVAQHIHSPDSDDLPDAADSPRSGPSGAERSGLRDSDGADDRSPDSPPVRQADRHRPYVGVLGMSTRAVRAHRVAHGQRPCCTYSRCGATILSAACRRTAGLTSARAPGRPAEVPHAARPGHRPRDLLPRGPAGVPDPVGGGGDDAPPPDAGDPGRAGRTVPGAVAQRAGTAVDHDHPRDGQAAVQDAGVGRQGDLRPRPGLQEAAEGLLRLVHQASRRTEIRQDQSLE